MGEKMNVHKPNKKIEFSSLESSCFTSCLGEKLVKELRSKRLECCPITDKQFMNKWEGYDACCDELEKMLTRDCLWICELKQGMKERLTYPSSPKSLKKDKKWRKSLTKKQ